MKILWLSHLIPYPPKGGVLQRSYNLLKQLSRFHEVDLLAFNQRSLIEPLFTSLPEALAVSNSAMQEICGRHRFFDIPSEVSHLGKHWLAARSLFSEPYNINWLKSLEFSLVLKTWVAEKAYDAVFFDTISLLPFYDLVPSSIARILDHHNIESHMLLRRASNEKSLLKKLYFFQEGNRLQRYEKKYCGMFDLNVTCSEVDSERLRQISPGAEVASVPNGVDVGYFSPLDIKSSERRLIFVGTMNWYPNIEAVMYIGNHLWPRLKALYPDIKMDIVGASPPPQVRRLADTLPDFCVHGFVDDVRPFIDQALVYLCPISDGGGTKLKILDAMAMAKAIVAHPVACEGIEVTDGQNVLFADNEDDFIRKISQLLDAESLRNQIGHDARMTAENIYSYTSIGKRFSDLVEDVVRTKVGSVQCVE